MIVIYKLYPCIEYIHMLHLLQLHFLNSFLVTNINFYLKKNGVIIVLLLKTSVGDSSYPSFSLFPVDLMSSLFRVVCFHLLS